jgi:hypothetical protein
MAGMFKNLKMVQEMHMLDRCREMYLKCAAHSHSAPLGTWYSETVLRMWMLDKAIQDKVYKAETLNYLFMDVEAKSKKNTQKLMKDLFDSYHGMYLSFDEGLYYNNQVLASNIYKNCMFSQGTLQELLAKTEWVVAHLNEFEQLGKEDLVNGKFEFKELPAVDKAPETVEIKS